MSASKCFANLFDEELRRLALSLTACAGLCPAQYIRDNSLVHHLCLSFLLPLTLSYNPLLYVSE